MAGDNGAGNNGHEELRIGVYVCHCGSNIAGVIPPGFVAEYAATLPGVVHATDTLYACADSGQTLIKKPFPSLQKARGHDRYGRYRG